MRREDVSPDARTYNTLIAGCSQAGQWERAIELMSELKGQGLVADAPTHAALISAHERAGNWKQVSAVHCNLVLLLYVCLYEVLVVAYFSSGS
jgi:pentatricopeptide repeat protein